MTEWEALLKAVYDEPDDDTRRLAFADYLDDHGLEPELAELIRIQCVLARLDVYPQSVRRIVELMKREEWLERFVRCAMERLGFRFFRFERGFPVDKEWQ
jgi:uncharacterized protein (TIGR02996 family)